jgi:hypothetical protein
LATRLDFAGRSIDPYINVIATASGTGSNKGENWMKLEDEHSFPHTFVVLYKRKHSYVLVRR